MIVLVADAFALAVLAFTAWAIDHLHLPLDLVHTLAAQVVAAVVTVAAGHPAYQAAMGRRAAHRETGGS